MSQPTQTLEQAVAAIKKRRDDYQLKQEQEKVENTARTYSNAESNFRQVYADIMPVLEASGITISTQETEEEEAWCDLVFSRAGAPDVRLSVSNLSLSNYKFSDRSLDDEEVLETLLAGFERKPVTEPRHSNEWSAEQRAERSVGKQPAFARPIGHNGEPTAEDRESSQGDEGMSKLEYFAGRNMQGLLMRMPPEHAYPGYMNDLADLAVKAAQSLLVKLVEAGVR